MTLFDLIEPTTTTTTTTRYACPTCPNRVTIHVEHDHAPTCSNRHDRRTMNREEHAR